MSVETISRRIASENATLHIQADFSQSSSPIRFAWTDRPTQKPEEFQSSPFQVADARHDRDSAFRLIQAWK